MKKITPFFLLFLCVTVAGFSAQTLTQKFYFDFGQDNGRGHLTIGADVNGNYWNNVIAPNGAPSTLNAGYTLSLVNSGNQTTPYVLETTETMRSNGTAGSGALENPNPALLGDLAIATATEDYFFIENNLQDKGGFKLKNLDQTKAYKFYVYGCRAENQVRTGVISVSGKNGSHGVHQNSGSGIGTDITNGNDNTIWQSALIVPDSNNEIYFELGILTGGFAYINAMKIEEYSGFVLPVAEKKFYIDFGKNNNGLDGMPAASPDINNNYWNNIYSNGDGPTTENADFMNIDLVASDNMPSVYRLETGSTIQWNGVRNGALTNPDPTLLGDLAIATATHDYLFIDGSQTAILHFKNLNRDKRYRFNIFGSRYDTSANRIGFITITGANSIKGLHQMGGPGISGTGGNDRNIFVSDPITPNMDNQITLELSRWIGMAYINLIKLEEIEGEDLPLATAIDISGGNSITSCGRSLQLTITSTPQGALYQLNNWSVDNENVAHITETGKLYAKANGTVTVTATANNEDGTVLTATKEIVVSGQNVGEYSLAIMGSSVPSGTGAESGKGYAHLYQKYLENSAGHAWTVTNISIGGNNTTDVINRWDNDFLATCSRYIYYGLSLGNEGIHERGQAAFDSYRDNMLLLIERARSAGKIPFMGNNYPRGDFNATDYNYVKQLNLLIHEWDVPSVNLLGAIDNGAGQWASGYIADNAHPNTPGHAEMFYVFVPSQLDAIAAGKPQPQRVENTSLTLAKTATAQRIAFTPENVLHSFTLTFSFKTTGTGTIASFITSGNDSTFLKINTEGKLTYDTYSTTTKRTSAAIVNDGEWHTVSLTHYYAWGKTIFYLDGTQVNLTPLTEKNVPVKFYLNAFEDAPYSVEYRELFLHRAGMSREEIQALHQSRMLKSSLEIYVPLNADADTTDEKLQNSAQSLNTLTLEEELVSSIDEHFEDALPKDKYIFSLTGQQIAYFPASENMSLTGFPKGVYILKQTDGKRISSEKIVVK